MRKLGFKKIEYGGGEGRFKIKIEDASGANEGSWTIMHSDLYQWVDMMAKKYGIKKKGKNQDLAWVKGDFY